MSCKLSPMKSIRMKCQILFSGKNKKSIICLSSAEVAQRVVKVRASLFLFFPNSIKVYKHLTMLELNQSNRKNENPKKLPWQIWLVSPTEH